MAVSGFYSNQVIGSLRAGGQISQWNHNSVNPSGHRHHESGVFKADAKYVPFRGGFTAQKESGVAIDFGQVLASNSGFQTDAVILTFNLGEVNSHTDSYFNKMVDASSIGTNFKAFNMRFWVGNLTAFSGIPNPTFYFLRSSEWREDFDFQPFISGIQMLGLSSGVQQLPLIMPEDQNIYAKTNEIVFISGNFKEKEFTEFIYIRGVFPSGNYLLGTYGGLGLNTFTFKFSYDYTDINANVINPQDLKDIAFYE